VKLPTKITALASAIVLAALPAAAFAQGGPGANHGKSQSAPGHTKSTHQAAGTSQPGPGATTTAKTKAYGRYCQSESKKHVAGTPGTPFSDCVNDMAQLSKSSKLNPHRACANESKTPVAGQSGTPYSQCVSAAAKLRRDQTKSSGSGTTGS
jgi:hypothetical protein